MTPEHLMVNLEQSPFRCVSLFKVQDNFVLLCSSTNFVGYSYIDSKTILTFRAMSRFFFGLGFQKKHEIGPKLVISIAIYSRKLTCPLHKKTISKGSFIFEPLMFRGSDSFSGDMIW